MPVYFTEILLWNREWSSDIESACCKAYILDWSISAVSAAFIKQDWRTSIIEGSTHNDTIESLLIFSIMPLWFVPHCLAVVEICLVCIQPWLTPKEKNSVEP